MGGWNKIILFFFFALLSRNEKDSGTRVRTNEGTLDRFVRFCIVKVQGFLVRTGLVSTMTGFTEELNALRIPVVLTSCWWDTVPVPQRPDFRLWWSYDPWLRPPSPRNYWSGSWRQRSDGSRLSWYHLCRWYNRSARLALSSRVSDCSPLVVACSCCWCVAGYQPVLPVLTKEIRRFFKSFVGVETSFLERPFTLSPSIIRLAMNHLPAGFNPPVLAGVARPPRPKAASPANGLLPSLPICNNDEEIHRSTKQNKKNPRAVLMKNG